MNPKEEPQGKVTLTIATYRDIFQWLAREKSANDIDYQERSAIVWMSRNDIKALAGMQDGANIRLSNEVGTVVVKAKLDNSCGKGFGYMPVSPYSNSLTSYDPERATLPNFKKIEVQAEPTTQEITPIADIIDGLVREVRSGA